jgi:hypothetical protein
LEIKVPPQHPGRTIVLIWLAWAITLIGFQNIVSKRLQPERPDRVLYWTPSETGPHSQEDKPYLMDPFLNTQVSWDSEFYLSIATVGYDDPLVRAIWIPDDGGKVFSLNYAFSPFYPFVIHMVRVPLLLLGLTPIATSTLAGVLVSLLGALGAMLGLYDMVRPELGHDGGIRAAFYLLIFPTGFYLAQVYTAGLFLGLTFGSIALVRRKQWLGASLLAVCATWTRPAGGLIMIPLAVAWLREVNWNKLTFRPFPWETIGKGLLVLTPLAAYLIWQYSYLGTAFQIVEHNFFSRDILALTRSWRVWRQALLSLWSHNSQTVIYYSMQLSAILVGVTACLLTLRRYPGWALFGLAVIAVPLTSGLEQGMCRYVLAIPSIFLILSRLGKNIVFDRAWTLASILLMGLCATLYTFDMWVG